FPAAQEPVCQRHQRCGQGGYQPIPQTQGSSMSDTYGMAPQGGDQRNRITAALMQIQQPPPAPAGGAMQSLAGSVPQAPPGVLPPSQPAAMGAAAQPLGAMGPVGGPVQARLRLPRN